jgi:hypothetical protein
MLFVTLLRDEECPKSTGTISDSAGFGERMEFCRIRKDFT